MAQRYPVRAVTHIHTDASNGLASEMEPMIGGAIREILGEETRLRWQECFTPVSRLARLLDDGVVGILVVTDHLNHRRHRLSEDLLRTAAIEPRLAAGGEVACVERDADGVYRKSPEVLVYGGADPVEGPWGRHFGVTQDTVEEIFTRCRPAGQESPSTLAVLDYCAERGIACALAHPFDGHDLSLEGTFEVISRGRFVETVNGGFPAVSARILEDFIALQNRLLSGARLPPALALRRPLIRRLADRICAGGRSLLHPWGGSDAHSHDFDRVTVRFLSEHRDPTAGDLFRAMLERPVEALLLDGTFSIEGHPGTAWSVLDDVLRIVVRNLAHNRPHIPGPWMFARMIHRTRRIVAEELGRRDRHQAALVRAVDREIDFASLLAGISAERPGRRECRPPAARVG